MFIADCVTKMKDRATFFLITCKNLIAFKILVILGGLCAGCLLAMNDKVKIDCNYLL